MFKWLWELPQNLCGMLWREINVDNIITIVENGTSVLNGATVYLMRKGGNVTLGKYIFINQDYTDKSLVIKHECGHVRQSKKLGPLYIPLIGIPSLIHAMINDFIGCCSKSKDGYSHFYTERWLMD